MLGSCSHAMMTGMYIERHNLAIREIMRLIMEGSHGNCYMLAYVGSEAKLGGLRALNYCLSQSDTCRGLGRTCRAKSAEAVSSAARHELRPAISMCMLSILCSAAG